MENKNEHELIMVVSRGGGAKFMVDNVEVDREEFDKHWPPKDESGDGDEKDPFVKALLKDLPEKKGKRGALHNLKNVASDY